MWKYERRVDRQLYPVHSSRPVAFWKVQPFRLMQHCHENVYCHYKMIAIAKMIAKGKLPLKFCKLRWFYRIDGISQPYLVSRLRSNFLFYPFLSMVILYLVSKFTVGFVLKADGLCQFFPVTELCSWLVSNRIESQT